ncbi:MAG TPA: arginine--tRNA ligase, partial [Nocardioidaceae bacterium]|nr:arginine--tRNA ligase [Nocardioidaceae bacterium]
MTPEQLSDVIVSALSALVERGEITLPDGVPDAVRVERPKQREHGDYATNVALQLAKKAGQNPREFAQLLADELGGANGVASAEVAGPGFLNLRVEAGAQGEIAAQVVTAGETYGTSDALVATSINLEFISANPTGPLHIGHTR